MLLDLLLGWIFLEATLAFLPPWCSLMSADGSQEGRMRHGQVIKSDFEIIFVSGAVYMAYNIRGGGGIWVRREEIFLRWNTSGKKILIFATSLYETRLWAEINLARLCFCISLKSTWFHVFFITAGHEYIFSDLIQIHKLSIQFNSNLNSVWFRFTCLLKLQICVHMKQTRSQLLL